MDTTILRLCLGALAVLAAIYLIWPQVALWLDRVKEPACGKCRYPARGIVALRCPECGSDLRQVGIITSGMMMRRKPGARTVVAAWTLVWALVMLTGVVGMSFVIPGQIRSTKMQPFTSAFDPVAIMEVELRTKGWRESAMDQEFALTLKNTGNAQGAGAMVFHWPDGSMRSATGSAASKQPERFDERSLAGWLADAGLRDTAAAAAATDLMVAVKAIADEPYNSSSPKNGGKAWNGGGSMASVGLFTPWWVQVGGGTVWVVIWAIVAAILAKRAERRRREHAAALQARIASAPIPELSTSAS